MFFKKMIMIGFVVLLFAGLPTRPAPAQIGERIDQAIDRIGGELRQGWEEARGAVNGMGLQARVYSRLRWDKDLQHTAIDLEVQSPDVVVLRGSVDTEQTRQKAVRLATDTVGVARVVDQLAVAPPTTPRDGRDPNDGT